MAYYDFMVTPAKLDRMAEYKKLVAKSTKLWKKCGAVSYMECVAEDVKPGKVTSFPQSLKLKSDEIVVVCVIAALLLAVDGYTGYAITVLAVGLAGAVNLT